MCRAAGRRAQRRPGAGRARHLKAKTYVGRRDAALVRMLFDTGARLLFDTGARLSEVARLTVERVDLDLDVVTVLGKGGRVRACPFGDRIGRASRASWVVNRCGPSSRHIRMVPPTCAATPTGPRSPARRNGNHLWVVVDSDGDVVRDHHDLPAPREGPLAGPRAHGSRSARRAPGHRGLAARHHLPGAARRGLRGRRPQRHRSVAPPDPDRTRARRSSRGSAVAQPDQPRSRGCPRPARPAALVDEAITMRPIGDARSAAAVLHWRLGVLGATPAPRPRGPLAWLPPTHGPPGTTPPCKPTAASPVASATSTTSTTRPSPNSTPASKPFSTTRHPSTPATSNAPGNPCTPLTQVMADGSPRLLFPRLGPAGPEQLRVQRLERAEAHRDWRRAATHALATRRQITLELPRRRSPRIRPTVLRLAR